MQIYSESENYKLYEGSMLDMLDIIEPQSIDSIVTDPPYELNFMGKGWDNSGIAFQKETWKKCFDVLKPGGYLLAFGGSRTFHRIACAIEDAGFEIRDTIMWLYGSGFPKSMNVGLAIDKKNGVESRIVGSGKSGSPETHTNSLNMATDYKSGIYEFGGEYKIKEAQNKWRGWGTCLKPSFEPIIVARKPFKNSLVDNVIEYGVGGINIDECRVETTEINRKGDATTNGNLGWKPSTKTYNDGRFPANTILTYDETDFEEVCGGFPNTKSGTISKEYKQETRFNIAEKGKGGNLDFSNCYGDSGSASRYFYCAKASKKDRDEGLEEFETKQCVGGGGGIGNYLNDVNSCSGKFGSEKAPHKNTHPTVKPTELMQYLVRLISPNGATILDCFNGSGSTGKAVMYENLERNKNYKYIGIDLSKEYLEISKARIDFVKNKENIDTLIEANNKQTTIFDFNEEE